jgi:hypothetical protein
MRFLLGVIVACAIGLAGTATKAAAPDQAKPDQAKAVKPDQAKPDQAKPAKPDQVKLAAKPDQVKVQHVHHVKPRLHLKLVALRTYK